MSNTTLKIALLVTTGLLLIQQAHTQDLKPRDYWLLYDVTDPTALQKCTSRPPTESKYCSSWNPKTEFFGSGSVIRVSVINGRFRSTYKVIVNGIPLSDSVPETRGVPSASAPATSPPKPAPVSLPDDPAAALVALKTSYKEADEAISNAETYLNNRVDRKKKGLVSLDAGNCARRIVNLPTADPIDILSFSSQLRDDAIACDCTHGQPFTNEPAFNNLTDRADRLSQSVTIYNSSLSFDSPLALIAAAKIAYTAYQNLAAAYSAKDSLDKVGAEDYLPPKGNGTNKYVQIANREDKIDGLDNQIVSQINSSMSEAFAYINTLYSISQSSEPFEIPIGQYGSSYAAQFSIYEVINFIPYSVTPAKASNTVNANDTSQQPFNPPTIKQPVIQNPFAPDTSPKPSAVHQPRIKPVSFSTSEAFAFQVQGPPPDPTSKKAKQTDTSGSNSQDTGKLIFRSGNFDVHKTYRANLVAGFFVSYLKNRQYSLTNNGQATSTANITYVAEVGPVTSPQYHAFVGVNVYLWPRDVYPGALRHTKWYKGYWMPGFMTGYGVDALNNYLLGANWETSWGINLGVGRHIGQETSLQSGVVPGVTQFPSAATSPLTTNTTEYGTYFSLGFDLGVMKTAIGQLFGK